MWPWENNKLGNFDPKKVTEEEAMLKINMLKAKELDFHKRTNQLKDTEWWNGLKKTKKQDPTICCLQEIHWRAKCYVGTSTSQY